MGPGGQGARRRANPRLHPRAVGADLHAASRLHGRRRDQGGTARRRRHHARPVARREGAGQPLFHHAQRQQALDHDRFQASQGQGNPRPAGQAMRRAGGEFRARRARPHGADLRAHPQAQSAHDRRLGEGISAPVPTRTARSTRTSRNAPAARLRRPASATARRSSPARRSAIAAPACISRSASSARSISASAPAAARRCSAPCRTACSISRA